MDSTSSFGFKLRDATRGRATIPRNQIGQTHKVKPFHDWQEFVRTVNRLRVNVVSPLDVVERNWLYQEGEKEVAIIFLEEDVYGIGYVAAMARLGYKPCSDVVPYFMGLVYQLTRDVNGPLCSMQDVCIVAAEPEKTDSVFRGKHIKEGHVYLSTHYNHMPLGLVETKRAGGLWHSWAWGFLGEKIPGFEEIDQMGLKSDNTRPLI